MCEVGSSKCMALEDGGVPGQQGLNMKRIQSYVVKITRQFGFLIWSCRNRSIFGMFDYEQLLMIVMCCCRVTLFLCELERSPVSGEASGKGLILLSFFCLEIFDKLMLLNSAGKLPSVGHSESGCKTRQTCRTMSAKVC